MPWLDELEKSVDSDTGGLCGECGAPADYTLASVTGSGSAACLSCGVKTVVESNGRYSISKWDGERWTALKDLRPSEKAEVAEDLVCELARVADTDKRRLFTWTLDTLGIEDSALRRELWLLRDRPRETRRVRCRKSHISKGCRLCGVGLGDRAMLVTIYLDDLPPLDVCPSCERSAIGHALEDFKPASPRA